MSLEIENLIKEAKAAGLARADKVLAARKSAEEEADGLTPVSGASIVQSPVEKIGVVSSADASVVVIADVKTGLQKPDTVTPGLDVDKSGLINRRKRRNSSEKVPVAVPVVQKVGESENEKKMSVELLKLKEKWLEIIRLAQSPEELRDNLATENFSFTGEDFKDVLRKYTLSSEEEKRAYSKVFEFSKEVKDAYENRMAELKDAEAKKAVPTTMAPVSVSDPASVPGKKIARSPKLTGAKVSKPGITAKPVATAVAKKGRDYLL